MGGGGSYYNRDVTPRRNVGKRNYSRQAEQALERSRMDAACNPKNRRLTVDCQDFISILFDVTGSMGDLPKIIWDKVAMIAGQIKMYGILEEPHISLGAIGDVISDEAPLQVCDPVEIKELDSWLQRIWLEGGGGGNGGESYELAAWFHAFRVNLTKAQNKLMIITGDEDYRDSLPQGDLRKLFGGKLNNSTSKAVFKKLLQQYDGNVILIHKKYWSGNDEIVAHWEEALGKGRILHLDSDKAIGDVILGVISMVLGDQSLDHYCQAMKERTNVDTGKPEPQSASRIKEVRKTLGPLAEHLASRPGAKKTTKKKAKPKKATGKKTGQKAKRPLR